MIITIDGPAASGKSTVAKAIAQKLHYYYLNSGMLYRALGYCLVHNAQVSLEDLKHCDIAQREKCLDEIHYHYDVATGAIKVLLGDNEVTPFLKEPLIDKAASLVGENEKARMFLREKQKFIGKNGNIIAEGRDAGSKVFPQAHVKFFLTAHVAVVRNDGLMIKRNKVRLSLLNKPLLLLKIVTSVMPIENMRHYAYILILFWLIILT